jgi:hypothetical protein
MIKYISTDLCNKNVCMSPSARSIIELNIKHYRELLKSETDAVKRRTVTQLLAEEEAKLAKLIAPPKESEG